MPGGTNADGDKSEIHSRPLDSEANRKSARHVVTCTTLGDVPRTHHLGAACQSRYLVQGHLEKWYTGCRDGFFSLVIVDLRSGMLKAGTDSSPW